MVNVGDKDALEKAICELIENRDKCKKIGENAKKIRSKFSIENIAEQWNKEVIAVIERKQNEKNN